MWMLTKHYSTMKSSAKLRYLNISPRKVRLVVDALRGLGAQEALSKLRFIKKRSAYPIEKLLRSAMANAEHNFSLDKGSLRIQEFKVDGGPMLKRFKPKALGRAAPIQRKTSHITIVLEGEKMSAQELEKRKKEQVVSKKQDPSTPPRSLGQPELGVSKKETKGDSKIQDESSKMIEKKLGARRGHDQEKKVKQDKKQSFAKRLFRRKSI